eukprot:gnl/Spiro4/25237_TR12564_c0_g1_i1.p3 gnl/Spiro4/25237_TR12564_c0_g1~~gnl/Spiro4/25237_TR12564_c0_g1_i1.p3  ORF type:complete len:175 (-),score=2.26 gnl/Spiro4/25237_TR12564_c0_g1_i1:667-1191(-)
MDPMTGPHQLNDACTMCRYCGAPRPEAGFTGLCGSNVLAVPHPRSTKRTRESDDEEPAAKRPARQIQAGSRASGSGVALLLERLGVKQIPEPPLPHSDDPPISFLWPAFTTPTSSATTSTKVSETQTYTNAISDIFVPFCRSLAHPLTPVDVHSSPSLPTEFTSHREQTEARWG